MNHEHPERNLLLVEDDPDHAELIRRYLNSADGVPHAVEWVDRLKKGLIRVAAGGIDAILLDLGLPDATPDETLRQMLVLAPHVPVIVLTAQTDLTAAARAVQHGAQDYLIKAQLNPDILARSIQYAIERKRIEDQLRRLNETLEQCVAERSATAEFRANQLRALASELILTEQRERRRLAAELHDYLAQLLVVCRMKLSLLHGRTGDDTSAAVIQETQELVENSLRYTRTLVAELSPTVLYEAGLDAALKWLAGQMEKHGLRVSFEQERQLDEIPEDHAVLVFQSVRELLFNVIKHARVSEASLVLNVTPGKELTVTVGDHGAGYDLATVRSDSATAPKFGLFSIQERLAAIGGHFGVVSAPGQGTRASLTIPIQAEARTDAAATTPVVRNASVPSRQIIRVLLADDHALVRQGLSSLLGDYGDVQVVGEAGNGEEAVELARMLQPDTVLMDINMPKLNGVEATRRIKAEMPSVTILALSVLDDKEMAAQMRRAGAEAYLTKDGVADELYETIRRLHHAKMAPIQQAQMQTSGCSISGAGLKRST